MDREKVWETTRSVKQRKKAFNSIVELLEFSCIYDLRKTKKYAESVLGKLLESQMFIGTFDLFDISAVKKLTELFLPLVEEEAGEGENKYKHFVSHGKSQVLWDTLVDWGFEGCELEGLTVEEINNNPMLPMLIKTFLRITATSSHLNETSVSARQVIQDLVDILDNAPEQLYQKMEHGMPDLPILSPSPLYGRTSLHRVGTSDYKSVVRMFTKKCLVSVIKHSVKGQKDVFEKLGVTIPNSYSS